MSKLLQSLLASIRWVFFVSQRFSTSDRTGSHASTALLSVLGIAFGTMTLITVISVMNGFQRGYIETIMEVSSYHIRARDIQDTEDFLSFVQTQPDITCVTPFYEAQALVVGSDSRHQGALIRAIPQTILETDRGFESQIHIISGSFDISGDSIVLGSTLARSLGVNLYDTVNLLALSGGSDTDLLSTDRIYTVSGIFYTGYSEINSTFAFVSDKNAQKLFGLSAKPVYGIKLRDSTYDSPSIFTLSTQFPMSEFESWRSYNRAFFGALQVEKNMLMLLVFFIFVVVAVNIYNAMRRSVYERREEISLLSALGGTKRNIQAVFILQGFLIGSVGSLIGLLLGMLICVRIDIVFEVFADLTYLLKYIFLQLVSPQTADLLSPNSVYNYYATIPARIVFEEVEWITLFGVLSALIASWLASVRVLKIPVAEVLRDE